MLSIKRLPPEEFERLPIKFDPTTTIAVVAQDDKTNEIKGICAAWGVALLEMWTSDDGAARGRTGLKMYAQLLTELAASGEPFYYAFSDTPEVSSYLSQLGLTELPYKVFMGLNPLLPKETQECLFSQLLSSPQSSVGVPPSVEHSSPRVASKT